MPPPAQAAVDPARVHDALGETAARVVALIRSIQHPRAHAVGDWSCIEVAVHLAHVWENLGALADARMNSPLHDIGSLGALTQTLVEQDADRDPSHLADRVAARAAAFLGEPSHLHDGGAAPWLVQGIEVPRLTLACHILSECLVHGHDMAKAERASWRIQPENAGMALMGFAFPLLAHLDPGAMVDRQRAVGLDACFEVVVRGAGHVFLDIRDGALSIGERPTRAVDCHLSADPATLLLLLFGRLSQWPAILTGRLFAWGRRPWLAPKLRQVLRNP